jgi:hypothetical protein
MMANCCFGWTNQVETGSLSVGSAASGLDASQLQNPIGSSAMAWQTAAGVKTSWLVIDAGSAVNWSGFGLFRTNLTASATVQWRVSAAADFSTTVFDSTVQPAGIVSGFGQSILITSILAAGGGGGGGGSGSAIPSNEIVTETGDPIVTETGEPFFIQDLGTGPSVLAWGVPVVGRYCRVDITDAANPDGFLNIPLCYAGEVWVPARNFTWASSMGRASQTTRVVTRGGQVYVARLWSQRYWKLVLQGIKHTEIWPKLMELDAAARDGRNILFVPNPDDADLQKSSVFGVLDPTSDLGYAFQSQDTRGWNATVTERL